MSKRRNHRGIIWRVNLLKWTLCDNPISMLLLLAKILLLTLVMTRLTTGSGFAGSSAKLVMGGMGHTAPLTNPLVSTETSITLLTSRLINTTVLVFLVTLLASIGTGSLTAITYSAAIPIFRLTANTKPGHRGKQM